MDWSCGQIDWDVFGTFTVSVFVTVGKAMEGKL